MTTTIRPSVARALLLADMRGALNGRGASLPRGIHTDTLVAALDHIEGGEVRRETLAAIAAGAGGRKAQRFAAAVNAALEVGLEVCAVGRYVDLVGWTRLGGVVRVTVLDDGGTLVDGARGDVAGLEVVDGPARDEARRKAFALAIARAERRNHGRAELGHVARLAGLRDALDAVRVAEDVGARVFMDEQRADRWSVSL